MPALLNGIAAANLKTDGQFIADYLQPSDNPAWMRWTHPHTGETYELVLTRAGGLSRSQLDGCVGLVADTSQTDYEESPLGWDRAAKRAEMRSPAMRYVRVCDSAGDMRAFVSVMPRYEHGRPVLYCYELHLRPELRRTGLGRVLMALICRVARNIPVVEAVMLTCFTRNQAALGFYQHLGFTVDPLSAPGRTLRNGRLVKPDQVIMSMPI